MNINVSKKTNNATQSKLKLLYFVPQFPTLSQTFIEREVSKLIELGNLDITVLSLAKGTGTMSEAAAEATVYEKLSIKDCFLSVIKFVLPHPLRTYNAFKLILVKDKVPLFLSFTRKNRDPRNKLSVLGHFHYSRIVHFLKGVAYTNMFSKYNPDYIHVQFLSESSTIAMISAKLLDIPFSITAHAKDVVVEGTLIGVKAKEAKFIAVCNGNIWKTVVDNANKFGAAGKVKLLYHGVPLDIFNTKPAVQKPDVPMIFSLARFYEKKGLRYLIEASKILKDQNIDHVFNVVGDKGPEKEFLFSLVREMGVLDTFKFVNQGNGIPNSKVMEYLNMADIFALTPINDAQDGDIDGVPTVIIEAALAGLPIVTTNAASISDLITKENGLIVSQKNANETAEALKKLINNPTLREDLGLKAKKKAIEMFNIDKNIKELQDLILS